MGKFVQMILETFGGIAPREVIVFLISTLPVLELRGGLLAASWLGIEMWRAVAICVAGCFLPVPFILLLIRRVLRIMSGFSLTAGLARRIEERAQEKGGQIRRTDVPAANHAGTPDAGNAPGDDSYSNSGNHSVSRRTALYEFWGLLIFVGIPLPGTGAWTGALVASLLGIRAGRAALAIFLGVLISAAMMTGVAYGILDLIL